jgi:dTDP-4-dehydrorhamnose reductase
MEWQRTKVCLLGSRGRLGSALVREFSQWPCLDATVTGEVDFRIEKGMGFESRLRSLDFDVLINATAFTSVDGAEDQAAEANWINGEAVGVLADIARTNGARFVHFSTDYVFDGSKTSPYLENDSVNPLGAYGKSKLLGEKLALEANPLALVLRTSWLFGPDRPSFPEWVLGHLETSKLLRVVSDCLGSPTYTVDLAKWVALLLVRHGRESGVMHLANSGVCSWNDYARQVLREKGSTMEAVPIRSTELPNRRAPRPQMSALAADRFTGLAGLTPRTWQQALAHHLSQASKPA